MYFISLVISRKIFINVTEASVTTSIIQSSAKLRLIPNQSSPLHIITINQPQDSLREIGG